VGLVPTMGALHEGHLSLIDIALSHADRAVVSLFVNPAQFAANEDLDTYPRDEDGDRAKLAARGAHLLYAPDVSEIYPAGFATSVTVAGPAEAGLEDRARPHFFAGVATVVSKLLIQAQCDCAVFGEKDYQQLLVIRRLARDLDIPCTILAGATERDGDGLALSSRNAYLGEEERAIAPHFHATLSSVADMIREGVAIGAACETGMRVLAQGGFEVDYLEVRDAETLQPVGAKPDGPLRVLGAAFLGKTRLIDNVAV